MAAGATVTADPLQSSSRRQGPASADGWHVPLALPRVQCPEQQSPFE
jgi:hypothetical protein